MLLPVKVAGCGVDSSTVSGFRCSSDTEHFLMKPGAKPLKSSRGQSSCAGSTASWQGCFLGGIYFAFTGENGVAKFALPIFGVPIILTVLNLVAAARQGNPEGKTQPVLAYAGLGERSCAFVVDYLILCAIDLAAWSALGSSQWPNHYNSLPEAYSLLPVLGPLVYFTAFEASPFQGRRQTLFGLPRRGRAALGCRGGESCCVTSSGFFPSSLWEQVTWPSGSLHAARRCTIF